MKLQEAQTIRRKFYEGSSTPEEEQAWREWLNANDCPQGWEADREVLNALSTPDAVALPEGFEQRWLNRWEQEQRNTARPSTQRKTRVRKLYRWPMYLATGIAAALVVVCGLWAYERLRPSVYRDTCTSPEQALAEINQAFYDFSNEDCGGGGGREEMLLEP